MLAVLILGAGVIAIANRQQLPTALKVNLHMMPSTAAPLSSEARPAVVQANQVILLSNDRANSINAAAAAFSGTRRTLADMRQEFSAISLADTSFRDHLVAANFPAGARPDVRVMIAAVERLITADSQIVGSATDQAAAEAYNRYLDSDANEKAAFELLRRSLN